MPTKLAALQQPLLSGATGSGSGLGPGSGSVCREMTTPEGGGTASGGHAQASPRLTQTPSQPETAQSSEFRLSLTRTPSAEWAVAMEALEHERDLELVNPSPSPNPTLTLSLSQTLTLTLSLSLTLTLTLTRSTRRSSSAARRYTRRQLTLTLTLTLTRWSFREARCVAAALSSSLVVGVPGRREKRPPHPSRLLLCLCRAPCYWARARARDSSAGARTSAARRSSSRCWGSSRAARTRSELGLETYLPVRVYERLSLTLYQSLTGGPNA